MRILQVFYSPAHGSLPENRTWYRNLYEPLIDLGHDVVYLSAGKGQLALKQNNPLLRSRFSQQLWETFEKEHKKKPFDLFFSYLKDGMVDSSVISDISSKGIPTCNFSCNNTHQFDTVRELSPLFDYSLHAERDLADQFKTINANPIWWPMASNPAYFKPRDLPRSVDVSFVGANYGVRSRYIDHLLKNGVDVNVFGPQWNQLSRTRLRENLKRGFLLAGSILAPSLKMRTLYDLELSEFDFRRNLIKNYPANLHPPVSDDELIALYSRSQISLGFLEVYDQHDPRKEVKKHLHLREFEGPMSGALYCTGYMEEIEHFFEPGKEILVYRDQDELLEKVTYYLQHPDEAEKIRKAGRERALREHTYHQRFQDLFKAIGLENG